MELRVLHFYPDLMSLYGSWGNIALLQRHLEDLGNTVTVQKIAPGDPADLKDADFIFMGAGTERSQKAALADFSRFGEELKLAAQNGVTMLFCGTAMQLLGQDITDADGTCYPGLQLADFHSKQGKQRFVGDVYGQTSLDSMPVVGFMNSCTIISGISTPLLTETSMGFGNETEGGAEGFHQNNVFGSGLTGPLLVKNPPLMRCVIASIYNHRGENLPESLPSYPLEDESYRIACQELEKRSQKN